MSGMVKIPTWMKKDAPMCAEFCEIINLALSQNPNMSLAAFAEQLSQANVEKTYERLLKAEKEQLYGGNGNERHRQS